MKFVLHDRRQSERIPDFISVKYQRVTEDAFLTNPEKFWKEKGQTHLTGEEIHVQPVVISANGIAFHIFEPIEPNSKIALELIFLPGKQKIYLFGIVLGCVPAAGFSVPVYELRVKFTDVHEDIRGVLISHINEKIRSHPRSA